MVGFFGWKITILYVISGIFIGVLSGSILGRMSLEKYIVKDVLNKQNGEVEELVYEKFKDRVKFGLTEAGLIVKKIWIWVLVGVGIGAAIHNYVPEELIRSIIGKTGVFSVPLATILGIPMYGGCAAIEIGRAHV